MSLRNLGLAFFICSVFLLQSSLCQGKPEEEQDGIASVAEILNQGRLHFENGETIEAIHLVLPLFNNKKALKASGQGNEAAYALMSKILLEIGAHNEALIYLHKSVFLRKKRLGGFDIICLMHLGKAGGIHLELNRKDSCFKNYRKANDIASSTDQPLFLASTWNNLGLAHAAFDQDDSAEICFLKSLDILKPKDRKDFKFKNLVHSNLAELYFKQGKQELALDLMRKIIDQLHFKRIEFKDRKPIFYATFVKYLLVNGQRSEVGIALDSTLTLLPKLEDKETRFSYLVHLYQDLLDAKYGDFEKFSRKKSSYQDSINHCLQQRILKSEHNNFNYQNAVRTQIQKVNNLQLTAKNQDILLAKGRIKLTIVIALSILLLSALLLLLISFKSHKKSQAMKLAQKMADLELENRKLIEQQLTVDLAHKDNDLTDLAIFNAQKTEWSERLLDKINHLRLQKDKTVDQIIRIIEFDIQQHNHSKTRVHGLQEHIEEINSHFKDKLLSIHPNLSQGEIDLCSLIKINMSGKEIALSKGISPQSVTKAKQRLRKKLNLAPNSDIHSYLIKL